MELIMPKKPAATAAPPTSNGLSPEAKRWFASVEDRYDLADHHRKLLAAACTMWDRAQEAKAALAAHGSVYTDRFGAPRPRPEVQIERDSLNAFRQLVHELGLDEEQTPSATRPPHPNSRKAIHYGGH